jgi:hypothetical protein
MMGFRSGALGRRLTLVGGAFAASLVLAAPFLLERFSTLTHLRLAIELRSEPHADGLLRAKLVHEHGAGFEDHGSDWVTLAKDGAPHTYRFELPRESVRGMALVVSSATALLEARAARLEAPPGAGRALPSLQLEVVPALPPAPTQRAAAFADTAVPRVLVHADGPIAGGQAGSLPGACLRLLATLLGETALLLLLWLLAPQLWRRLGLFAIGPMARGLYLGTACLAVLVLARESRFDAHPDEGFHTQTATYYVEHWLPPGASDPQLVPYLHALYGVSYLMTRPPEIAYLAGAKLTTLFFGSPFAALSPESDAAASHAAAAQFGLALRFFSWALLVLLSLVLMLRVGSDPIYPLLLLLTPQLWYIFSYFNGDTLPFFAAFLLAFELGRRDSAVSRFLEAPAWRQGARGAVLGGGLIALLLLAKANYYPFLLFLLFYAAWQVLAAVPGQRRQLARRWALLGCLAVFAAGPFLFADLARNGFDKAGQVEALRELHAAPAFKPSAIAQGDAYPGLALHDRGIPFGDLFRRLNWHRLTAESFLGLYGYVSAVASPACYLVQALVLGLVLAVLSVVAARRLRRRTLPLLVATAGCCLLLLAASLYRSWFFDFQPQGRYLFPALPMLLVLWRTLVGEARVKALAFLLPLAWLVSMYSFVTVAIAGLVR